MNSSVREFKGEEGVLSSIVLTTGEHIAADLCVLGVGVNPCTDFIQGSGVQLNSKNYVVVNKVRNGC